MPNITQQDSNPVCTAPKPPLLIIMPIVPKARGADDGWEQRLDARGVWKQRCKFFELSVNVTCLLGASLAGWGHSSSQKSPVRLHILQILSSPPLLTL